MLAATCEASQSIPAEPCKPLHRVWSAEFTRSLVPPARERWVRDDAQRLQALQFARIVGCRQPKGASCQTGSRGPFEKGSSADHAAVGKVRVAAH